MIKQKKIIFYFSVIILSVIVLFSLKIFYKKTQLLTVKYISSKIHSEMKKAGRSEQLKWEKMSVSFIPLKVKIEKITINIPNNEFFPAPLTTDTLIVKPDYMMLLNRTLSAKITLINSNITIREQNKRKGKNHIQKHFSMKSLKRTFISNLILKNTNLSFIARTNTVSTKNLNTNIRLHPSKITVKAGTPFMQIGSRPVFSSSVHAAIRPNKVHITHFTMKNKHSWLNISSNVEGEIESQNIQKGQIEVDGSFFSEDLNVVAQIINSNFDNPFNGEVMLKSKLKYDKASGLNGHIDLSARKFYAWNTFLSNVQIKGTIQNQVISFDRFQINNEKKWNINFGKSTVQLKKPYRFKTEVLIKNSQLHSLFTIFKLNKIPITSRVNSTSLCNGVFSTRQIQCEGTTRFNTFIVYGGKKKTILDIPKLTLNSQISLQKKNFSAYAKAQIGSNSEISIDSTWNEETLFSSRYQGTLHFSDINNLVHLKPKGIMNILAGKITTANKELNIQSEIDLEQFTLSQFQMGDVKAQVNYTKNGLLRFRKINGQIKNSKYKGNLNINLFKNTIQMFSHFPFYITLEDLKYALKDRVYFPFQLTGTGTLSAYLNGPLKINALNYNLQAQLFKIKWEEEFFNKAIIQLESKEGYVKTKQVELLKNKGKILFQGEVDPKGNMLAKMTGMGIPIQESQKYLKNHRI